MLKYKININDVNVGFKEVKYNTYNISNTEDINGLYHSIVFCNFDSSKIKLVKNDNIYLYKNINKLIYNENNDNTIIEKSSIIDINEVDNIFSFNIKKYEYLQILDYKIIDGYCMLLFDKLHFFRKDSKIALYIQFDNTLIKQENIIYVNDNSLKFIPNSYLENILKLNDKNLFKVFRLNVLYDELTILNIYTNKEFLSLKIPFSNNFSTDLQLNNNIEENFVNVEKEKSLGEIIDMEKIPYHPFNINNGKLTKVKEILFNIHFRKHRGIDWQCDDDSLWNGVNDNNVIMDDFFSYTNKSEQSDLLVYSSFTDSDIRYQKNKLKKSFLRLTFYDSKETSSQNLLAYSTIFFDSGKLYTKFIINQNTYPYKKIKEFDNKKYNNYIEGIYIASLNSSEELINDALWSTSEYINISGCIEIRCYNVFATESQIYVIYDENKKIISKLNYNNFSNKKIILPNNSYYLRISFMNINKEYTFVSNENDKIIWKPNSVGYIIENDLYGIKNDREPYGNLINDKSDNEIENYRLSTQFSIKDKYSSNTSSEGFYLYLWKDIKEPIIPKDIYMKIEYNNAEYGRTIPLMMPYYTDNEKGIGIKNYETIINDWTNGMVLKDGTSKVGYSLKRYLEYSYIKLKYKYSVNDSLYVYYLDDELYGNDVIDKGDKIILNLYEAKIVQ